MESIKSKSIVPFTRGTRGKRKINDEEKSIIVFDKNQFKVQRFTKKNKTKMIKEMKNVFQDRTVSFIPILFNNKMTIDIPSETADNVSYIVSVTVGNGKVKLDCNCQKRFLGEDSPNRTNCKHVAFVLKSFLYNYFCPKTSVLSLAEPSIYDIVKFLNQEKLCIMNYQDDGFRSRFMKAYKVLDKMNYLYPDQITNKYIDIELFESNRKYNTRISFNNGGLSASCDCNFSCSGFKCRHIKNILVSFIKYFIFSFKPNKKVKKMTTEEEELSKLFEGLEL